MARIQIPFAFSYASGTVYVAPTSGGSPTTQAPNGVLEPVVGASVSVTNRDTLNPATVFQGETGASTYSSIVTDSGGNVPGWVDPGSYKIQVAASGAFTGATENFEAIRGDAVTNLANGSVGALQLQNGIISVSNLVTAVQQALVPTGVVFDCAGATAPGGYALCDGSGHQPSDSDWSTTWATLFSVIGTTYGSFGTGGFHLPNPQGKFVLGNGSGVGGYQGLGVTGGALGHVHGLSTPSVTIALGTPSVTVTVPTVQVPNHVHELDADGGVMVRALASSSTLYVAAQGAGPAFQTTGWSSVTGSSASNVGANSSKGIQSTYALTGATAGNPTNMFTNNGSNYGAGGNVNSGQSASGNVNSGQNTLGSDPSYIVFNKIIKL